MAESTIQTTPPVLTETDVQELWQAFQVFDADGSGSISTPELGRVMASLGQTPSTTELRELIQEVDIDRSGSIDFEEFKSLLLSRQGDRSSRLQLAFDVFDTDHSGYITAKELAVVTQQFGLSAAELDAMLKEVDGDGDGSIDFAEFCQLVPDRADRKTGSQDPSTLHPDPPQPVSAPDVNHSTTAQPHPQHEISETETPTEKTLATESAQSQRKRGTSRRQMQIGLFRLIQGAAYRSFRESFSANHETHLRVKNLPYRITDFVVFVQKAIELYKGLEIVETGCYPLLDAVVDSITQEYARLQTHINTWDTLEKTPEMLAEATAMQAAQTQSTQVREKFAAAVEFAITLNKQQFQLGDVLEGVLAVNELNRLRQQELRGEAETVTPAATGQPRDYLKTWHRVILKDATEAIPGAMMPVAYWYEDFMPKLLAAFSVTTVADIPANTIADEAALDHWYVTTQAKGDFARYGGDVVAGFMDNAAPQKLMIQQAWQLTHHYLNGVQKRREREEFGRDSGNLSQYVAFIDVYLGRQDVQTAQMRVSFPYYLGPAVWRFFHTSAEIVCSQPPDRQKISVAVFKEFFQKFATMYPCPYCRHHLNMYVVQNREVDLYPIEYLLLGRSLDQIDFQVHMTQKLATVVDGPSLRLFFWKLHNTVSSSIARTEAWYQKDDRAIYTSRYWPSLDSELAKAIALQQSSLSLEQITKVYGLIAPTAKLASVRSELHRLCAAPVEGVPREVVQTLCTNAQAVIAQLETLLLGSGFLQEVYHFEPELIDELPYFTPEEEEYARSGLFTEIA